MLELNVAPVLEKRNGCVKDEDILFDEEHHIYSLKSDPLQKFTSVTTVIHELFPVFDADIVIDKMMKSKKWSQSEYFGMTKQEIKDLWNQRGKDASAKGTILHNNIEFYMNNENCDDHRSLLEKTALSSIPNSSDEWQYFLQFVKDFPDMKPFRTEWRVYALPEGIAGSIDMTYINDDGTLSIYDWKRSKEIKTENKYQSSEHPYFAHLPDCNFYHYSMQLNTYKAILELYYGYKVRDLFLIILHPVNSSYLKIECADLQKEVSGLFEERRQLKKKV